MKFRFVLMAQTINRLAHFCYLSLLIGFISCNKTTPYIEVGNPSEVIPEVVDFNFHIKPILSDRCFACHGPDKGSRSSGLRLDTEEGAFMALGENKDRYAIVANNPDSSEVVKRIYHEDPKEIMPPPESNLKLSDYEKKLITRWIEQGATWKKHWAFIPPQKTPQPEVKNADWMVNPIDAYVLAQLEKNGLQPETRAKKEQLLRRVSFDLTGLPPSLDEIESFMNDQSDNAFEKVVDRLLASEAYGERMSSEWLDVARYADTHGYQDDLKRNMWPWRDWVINAFNKNMPYDQFIEWQIAGDMLEDATYEQKLATAFNRNHRVNQEGGIIDEEFRVEYVVDRTNTTGTAFLGLTVSCAQCHDHKYDPISTKEYYQLYAFFNNVPEKGRIEYDQPVKPLLKVPEEKVREVKNYLDQLIAEENIKLENRKQEVEKNWDQLENRWKAHGANSPAVLPEGVNTYLGLDGTKTELNSLKTKRRPDSGETDNDFESGKFARSFQANGNGYLEVASSFETNNTQPFSIGAWIQTEPNSEGGAILSQMKSSGSNSRGLGLFLEKDKIAVHLVNSWPFKAIRVVTKESIAPMKWTHVLATYDGSEKASGINIYVNGLLQVATIEMDNLEGSIRTNESLKVGAQSSTKLLSGCRIDEALIYSRALTSDEALQVSQFDPIMYALSLPPDKRSEDEHEKLFNHYLYHQDVSFKNALTDRYLSQQRKAFMDDPTANEVMIMEEMPVPRQSYILERGGYENHGEPVEPGTIASVLEFPEGLPKNRLGLAEWLTSQQNPLTARVTINRYWQLLFGFGIVSTSNDFGSQGDLPSHPELLDWLAVDFMESNWDLKRAIKQMVMSATYQQASTVSQEKYEIDPQNRLLARGARFRLPAEMLRDQVLAISGLLVDQIGGPSVKPYQPQGLWEEVTSGRGLTSYDQGVGDDLYRRSLYTYWKRTVPPPSMMIFDASEKNLCTVKRQSTSTPLQALVLLNDPQYVEASRLLAERVMLEGGDHFDDWTEMAFKLATSRQPSEEEMEVFKEMYEQQKSVFNQAPDKANELLRVGQKDISHGIDATELAAMTIVTNAILNLSETITRG